MTHYEISYAGLNGPADEKALADIKAYLGEKPWLMLMQSVAIETTTCRMIDLNLSFAGVQGFPVFAFMRKFRPVSYQAWYDSLPDR